MSTIKSSAENLTLNADGANNDIIIQSNGSTKVTVDGATGNVGIGTSAPARLFAVNTGGTKTDTNIKYVQNLVQSNEGSNQACLGVYFKGASSAADRIFQLQPAELGVANDGLIEVNPDGGKFRANRGVLFGTDTAAANTLDDYEEGTWTPTFIGSSGGTGTWASATHTYTKVGRVVTFNAFVTATSLGDASNAVIIGGLPFTANAYYAVAIGYAGGLAITAGNYVGGFIDVNSTRIYPRIWNATLGTAAYGFYVTELTADGSLMIQGTYHTDS